MFTPPGAYYEEIEMSPDREQPGPEWRQPTLFGQEQERDSIAQHWGRWARTSRRVSGEQDGRAAKVVYQGPGPIESPRLTFSESRSWPLNPRGHTFA